jgi:hypothetical protein
MPLPSFATDAGHAKEVSAEQREHATRMGLDRLDEYGSAWGVAQALGPKLGFGPERRRMPTSAWPRNPKIGLDFLREGTRPWPPMIVSFIDEQCATGRGVESVCAVTRACAA